jgi:hypothetical protein
MPKIGTFTLESGVMRVTDPCYTKDGGFTFEALPGEWIARILYSDHEARVSALIVTHSDFANEGGTFIPSGDEDSNYEPLSIEGKVVTVGVDSGQAGFFDDAKYPEEPGDYEGPSFYHDACEATDTPDQAGIVSGFGVASSSGYGDGGYECSVIRTVESKVVSAILTFIDEEEEDEFEEEEEEDEFED